VGWIKNPRIFIVQAYRITFVNHGNAQQQVISGINEADARIRLEEKLGTYLDQPTITHIGSLRGYLVSQKMDPEQDQNINL
jgi:hypothetical protein